MRWRQGELLGAVKKASGILGWMNRSTETRSREVIIPLCSAVVHPFRGTKYRKEVDKHDWDWQRTTERLWDLGWFSQEERQLWEHPTAFQALMGGVKETLLTAVHGSRGRSSSTNWNMRGLGWSHENSPAVGMGSREVGLSPSLVSSCPNWVKHWVAWSEPRTGSALGRDWGWGPPPCHPVKREMRSTFVLFAKSTE